MSEDNKPLLNISNKQKDKAEFFAGMIWESSDQAQSLQAEQTTDLIKGLEDT